MIEICLGGSIFGGVTASLSTLVLDMIIGAGVDTGAGSGFISGFGSDSESGL